MRYYIHSNANVNLVINGVLATMAFDVPMGNAAACRGLGKLLLALFCLGLWFTYSLHMYA